MPWILEIIPHLSANIAQRFFVLASHVRKKNENCFVLFYVIGRMSKLIEKPKIDIRKLGVQKIVRRLMLIAGNILQSIERNGWYILCIMRQTILKKFG